MPNWCDNKLILRHEDPEMIQRAQRAFRQGGLLNEFIPVPEALKETTSGFFGDKDKQTALEEQTRANTEKYGYGNWYDFCVNEWGTKWDIGGDDSNDSDVAEGSTELDLYFQSAWSPPLEAYAKLEDLGFEVTAFYYEPGCAFAGVYRDGDDDCYDLSGLKAHELRKIVPEDIDEIFGIVENAEMWEEENEEQ